MFSTNIINISPFLMGEENKMSEVSQDNKNSRTKVTPAYKKWWFWVIIVVLVLVVGGVASSSGNDEPKKVGENSENSGNSETSGSGSDSKSTFKVGDTVAVNGREMTIKEVVRNYTPKYMKAGDGKEYVLIRVEFKNTSDDKISWTSSEWKMEDSDGAIESTAIGANDEDDILNYGDIAAGGKKSGSLVFEVPTGDNKLKVHYQPNMFADNDAIIEL